MSHLQKLTIYLSLFCSTSTFAYDDDVSYLVGISSTYTSTQFEKSQERQGYYIVLPNNIIIERPSEINNYKEKKSELLTSVTLSTELNVTDFIDITLGVDAQHLNEQSKSTLNDKDMKISGYYRTLANIDYAMNFSDSVVFGFFASSPIDSNTDDFDERKFVSYGAYLQLIDAENFAVQLSGVNTKSDDLVLDKNKKIEIGDTLNASLKFRFGFSRKAQFFFGADHYRKNKDLEFISNKKTSEFGASNGTAATFGVDYSLDAHKHHRFNFELRTAIDDTKGSVNLGYRHAF